MSDLIQKDRNNNTEDLLIASDDDYEDSYLNKYMSFRIGKESYGIGIQFITEIIEMQKIIELPDVPQFVKGIINLRGKIIPVIDLRLRFHLEPRAYDDRTCVVITSVNQTSIGFIVDTVEEVIEIDGKHIDLPPSFKTKDAKDKYISGIGKVGDAVKIILDVNKILFEEDVEILKSAVQQQI